jgi:hypothetical protein
MDLDALVAWVNSHCPRLSIVAPQSKRLACGDVGVGGLAEVEELVAAVEAMLNHAPRRVFEPDG